MFAIHFSCFHAIGTTSKAYPSHKIAVKLLLDLCPTQVDQLIRKCFPTASAPESLDSHSKT